MTSKNGGRTQSDQDKRKQKEKAAEDVLKEMEKLFKKFRPTKPFPQPKPKRKPSPPPLVKQREAKYGGKIKKKARGGKVKKRK